MTTPSTQEAKQQTKNALVIVTAATRALRLYLGGHEAAKNRSGQEGHLWVGIADAYLALNELIGESRSDAVENLVGVAAAARRYLEGCITHSANDLSQRLQQCILDYNASLDSLEPAKPDDGPIVEIEQRRLIGEARQERDQALATLEAERKVWAQSQGIVIAEREAAKKDAVDWKATLDMYANAWKRELGAWPAKTHEIDALALGTKALREHRDALLNDVSKLNQEIIGLKVERHNAKKNAIPAREPSDPCVASAGPGMAMFDPKEPRVHIATIRIFLGQKGEWMAEDAGPLNVTPEWMTMDALRLKLPGANAKEAAK